MNKKLFLLIIFLAKGLLVLTLVGGLFFATLQSVSAATYYVNADTGNDSYNGLYESPQGGSDGPFATISQAVRSLASSEENTVNIATGTYDNEAFSGQGVVQTDYTTTFQAQGEVLVRKDTDGSGGTLLPQFKGDGTVVFKGSNSGENKSLVFDLYNTGDGGTSDSAIVLSTTGIHFVLEDIEIIGSGSGSSQPGILSTVGSVVVRRSIIQNLASSYGVARTPDLWVESSFFKNNTIGVRGANFQEVNVFNNTFYTTSTSFAGADVSIVSPLEGATLNVANNLHIYGGGATDSWSVVFESASNSINYDYNVSNNLAWKTATLSSPRVSLNYPYIENNNDKDFVVNNLLIVDPLAVDPENSPEISDTSLAVGRGLDTGVITDFRGNSFTSDRHDIGAWSVGDAATKQYITPNDEVGLVVGDSFCDSHYGGFTDDDFDEYLISREFFSDWTFIKGPGTDDSLCFSGRQLINILGAMTEFVQDSGPQTVFLMGGFNDLGAGNKSAQWVINQIEEYEDLLADLTNGEAEFISVTQPEDGCTPITTKAQFIENNATFPIAHNIEGFINDDSWETYYSCPDDSVHPIAAGYEKLAEYTEHSYKYYYQTPYQMGNNEPDIGANVRIFGTGKFRNVESETGTTANLSIVPISNSILQYLDIQITTWKTSDDYAKQWIETSVNITGNVNHTVGDLAANQKYMVKVDGVLGKNISGENCSGGICTSNGAGEISFAYTGGFSSHTFSVVAYSEAESNSSGSNSSTPNSTPRPSICSDARPVGQADLFQIDRSDATARLYFTPVSDHTTQYHVIYGFKPEDERFGGVNMQAENGNDGVQSLVISDLDPKAEYSFTVLPVNGCAVGERSNWLSTEKTSGKTSIFYRYYDMVRRFF